MHPVATRKQAYGLAQRGRSGSFFSPHHQWLVTQAAIQQAFSAQHFNRLNHRLSATHAPNLVDFQMLWPNAQNMTGFGTRGIF